MTNNIISVSTVTQRKSSSLNAECGAIVEPAEEDVNNELVPFVDTTWSFRFTVTEEVNGLNKDRKCQIPEAPFQPTALIRHLNQ